MRCSNRNRKDLHRLQRHDHTGARLVVGLDTGFAHVAAALGRPVVGIYCDHEPGLTGITGNGPGASLGGKGQQPSFEAVASAVQRVSQAAGLV